MQHSYKLSFVFSTFSQNLTASLKVLYFFGIMFHDITSSKFSEFIPYLVVEVPAIPHMNSETNPPTPIISVVCKYLRQFLGTSFGVATLPI